MDQANMGMKGLLIVGGGAETIPGVQIAKDMGLHVVMSDKDLDCPCRTLADGFLHASTYDTAKTVDAAQTYHNCVHPLHGVLSIGTDTPKTVASVATWLKLPSTVTPWTADFCCDKVWMKDQMRKHGVSTPWYRGITKISDLDEVYQKATNLLVIKPVDSRGARGVIRLLPKVDIQWAYLEALQHSHVKRLIVEQWVEGQQISTEGLVVQGVYHHVATVDRNYARLDEFTPYVIEDGGSQPTILSNSMVEQVIEQLRRAALGIDHKNGVLKGDVVTYAGKAYVIEVAPRLSGGYMSTTQMPLATGVPLVELAIRQALGEQLDLAVLRPKWHKGVAIRYTFPQKPTSHPERGQHFIATADTALEAIAEAERLVRESH